MSMKSPVNQTEALQILTGERGAQGDRAVRQRDLEAYLVTLNAVTREAQAQVATLSRLIDVLADPSTLPGNASDKLALIAAARALAGIGANHVPNSRFSNGLLHWYASAPLGSEITWDLRAGGLSWSGPDRSTMRIWQDGSAAQDTLVRMIGTDGARAQLYGIHSIPGRTYQVSAKLSTHRCIGKLHVRWIDSAGAEISRVEVASVDSVPGASDNPSSWEHVGAHVLAPAGTAYRQIEFTKLATEVGQADSYAFLYEPFSVETSPAATALQAYSPGYDPVVSTPQIAENAVTKPVYVSGSGTLMAFDGAQTDVISGTLNRAGISTVIQFSCQYAGPYDTLGDTVGYMRFRVFRDATQIGVFHFGGKTSQDSATYNLIDNDTGEGPTEYKVTVEPIGGDIEGSVYQRYLSALQFQR